MKNTIKESLFAIVSSIFYILIWKLIGIEVAVCCGMGQIIAAITFSNNDKT